MFQAKLRKCRVLVAREKYITAQFSEGSPEKEAEKERQKKRRLVDYRKE